MNPTQTQLAIAIRDSLCPGTIAYRPTVATLVLEDVARAAYGERTAHRIKARGVSLYCNALLGVKE